MRPGPLQVVADAPRWHELRDWLALAVAAYAAGLVHVAPGRYRWFTGRGLSRFPGRSHRDAATGGHMLDPSTREQVVQYGRACEHARDALDESPDIEPLLEEARAAGAAVYVSALTDMKYATQRATEQLLQVEALADGLAALLGPESATH